MFHFVVPAYNCLKWLPRCLDSIRQQEAPFRVVVIDDASTEEGQRDFIQQYCDEQGWTAILNDTNMKCPYNLKLGIETTGAAPDDVIFLVDGDDYIHDHALRYVSSIYEDPEIWLTYGSYRSDPPNVGCPPAKPFPQEIVENNEFRKYLFLYGIVNHPLIFRKFLWDQLTDEDLQDNASNWFTTGYDVVIMTSMLELAGQHYRFLNEILYVYNAGNPLSENLIYNHRRHEEVFDRPSKRPYVRT